MSELPSSSQMARQILFTRMNRNESDDKFDNALLVQLSSDTAVRVQDAAGKAAQSLVTTLQQLDNLGFDATHEVATNQIKVNDKINDVLVKLAEAAARHAS